MWPFRPRTLSYAVPRCDAPAGGASGQVPFCKLGRFALRRYGGCYSGKDARSYCHC
jgi:hypothetical protein